MNILWVSDFFLKDGVFGGAEQVDDIIIDHLSTKADLFKVNSHALTSDMLKESDHIVLSNFVNIQHNLLKQLPRKKYSIVEHDHKYLKSRNPSIFKKEIPKQEFINLKVYKDASVVFAQSQTHTKTIKKHAKIKNIVDLKTSMWTEEQYNILRKNIRKTKNSKAAIMGTSNPNKNKRLAILYCKKNNIPHEVIPTQPWPSFIEEISKYSKLVFFPNSQESFCRLVAESRVLEMEVITNNNVPLITESWFSETSGEELLNHLEQNKEKALEKIEKHVLQQKEKI